MSAQTDTVADSSLVVCPQCDAIVRVPSARLAEQPRCSRCKSALLTGKPIALDRNSFAAHTGRSSLPVLVDFWAPWCGPCRMMAPVLDRLAHDRATTLRVAKLNTDEQPEMAARFNIRSIPTLILFRGGREIARQSGAANGGALGRWVDTALQRT
jgi:thioredoxin 2